MALIARLMEVPNATSRLATEASALWELADVFSQSGSDTDADGLDAFEELAKLTLGHLISTKDQDRTRKYLKKFHARLSNALGEGGISPDQLGIQCLVKASLSVFWLHHTDLLKPLKEKEIERLRVIHLDGVISELMNRPNNERPAERTRITLTTNLLMSLDCMLEYTDLLGSHEQRAEGRSRSVTSRGSPANLSVNSTLSDLLKSMTPVPDDHIETKSDPMTTDRFVSQGLTTLYSLSSCMQDDRSTAFRKISSLLQLLRISGCNPIPRL